MDVNKNRPKAYHSKAGGRTDSPAERANARLSQTTARMPKSVTDKPLPHSSGYAAALASAPVLPQISVIPVALPIGTPLCFLPAERGLVSYPTPPPYGC